MPWVGFPTKALFDEFHDQACADHGIPRPGKRQSDGVVMIDDQWTDAFAAPLIVDAIVSGQPRKVGVMHIPPGIIAQYNLGARVISDPVPVLGEDGQILEMQVTYQGNTYTLKPSDGQEFPYQKPKPPVWTDPDTGIEYPT